MSDITPEKVRRFAEAVTQADKGSAIRSPERMREILVNSARDPEQMREILAGAAPQVQSAPALDRDQQAAFYLLQMAEEVNGKAVTYSGYSDYGNTLAEFDRLVADRIAELAHALQEKRILVAPAATRFTAGEDA